MADPVLDTVVLQAFGFGDHSGIDILLGALGATCARFPAEVYNADEKALPLGEADETLSELARGLRYAEGQVLTEPPSQARRYEAWLENAKQFHAHFAHGTLYVDALGVEDLPRRAEIMERFGVGRGEAACFVLAERAGAPAIFVSADQEACAVADDLGVPYRTIHDVLESWVNRPQPNVQAFDDLIAGMRAARHDPGRDFVQALRRAISP